MPDLTGLPVVSAQNIIARVGLKPGEPKFEDVAIPAVGGSDYAPAAGPGSAPAPTKTTALPGTVMSQSPPAGYRVDVGATVTFTVAK